MRPLAWLSSSILLLLATEAHATVPAGFEETSFTSPTLATATGMAWAPDGSGRLFVLRKSGEIRVVRAVAGRLETEPATSTMVTHVFATEPAVHTNGECGLLGIVFDPSYVVNRFVYVFVSTSATQQQIVRYMDVDGGLTAAGTGARRTVIVNNLPSKGGTHVGGGLAIGSDGKLLFSIGDLSDGTGVDADLTSMASKLNRANLDGTPANDNPFNDGVGPNNEYVWARGFRNPFGLVRQPTTGRLWVNVAGTGYEQVFVPSARDHAGYNDYENNQPAAGYLAPSIVYRTNGVDSRTLTALIRAAGVVTATTTANHGFRRGQVVTVAGSVDPSFAGPLIVVSTTATTFTAAQAGPNASTTGGTVETESLGGAITRGDFYDSTAFPVEYRGNYFFGDFNSGNLVRARVSDVQVDHYTRWGSGFSQNVHITPGPDGALYTIGATGGVVRRVSASAPAGRIVVSNLNTFVPEGGRAAVAISLASAPAAEVVVNVTHAAGDADLAVTAGASLRFSPSDWRTPQPVEIAAAPDDDTSVDVAELDVTAPGLATERIHARSIEANVPRLVLSVPTLEVPEGGDATFTVALSARPGGNRVVTVTRTQGDADLTVLEPSLLTFTPANWATPQTLTVAAAQDDDALVGRALLTLASAEQATSIEVTEIEDDEPPVLSDAGTDDAGADADAGDTDAQAPSGSSSSGQTGSSGATGPGASSGVSSSGSIPGTDTDGSTEDEPAGGGCTMHAMATGSSLWLGLGLLALRRQRRIRAT